MLRQDGLVLKIESPDFPCEGLSVCELSGTEAISRLFDLALLVACPERDGLPAEAMIGAQLTVSLEQLGYAGEPGSAPRRISGVIVEVEDLLATHVDWRFYRLRLAPRASALTLVETQDIFIDLNTPQILEQKLAAVCLGSDMTLRLAGTYAAREFVVQYRETDYALICRLTEHVGMSFFFEQEGDADRIVFTDHNAGFPRVAGAESIPFRPRGEERDVFAFTEKRRVIPSHYAVVDYNYRTPHVDITGQHKPATGIAGGVVEYGTHHKTPAEGAFLARVRAEEREAGQLVYAGRSAVPALAAGRRFVLEDHPVLGALELLVTAVEHRVVQALGIPSVEHEAPGYFNTFHAIPAARAYRPPRVTPRPRIHGLVTGIIDSGDPSTNTPYAKIDEQGRYLVRFLFDATPSDSRPPSRPVRMAQNHAGEHYGTHFPLKPDIEVVIGFIDGDPDRPVIVGALPNPLTPSPVTNASPGVHRIRTSSGITVDIVE
jgi:type VI secretion system secreted protein VgrG